MDGTTAAAPTLGARPFAQADLVDPRRHRRLVQHADELTGHPGGTLPDQLRQPKDLKAFYRLMNQPRVTQARVLASHRQQTLERRQAHHGPVVLLHDTTTLDYSDRTSLADVLGQIGDGQGRGYLCPNTLAVAAATKEVFGLANQILFHRPDVPPHETKKQRQQRETR